MDGTDPPQGDDGQPTAKDLFFKTRLCKFYMSGRCKRGNNCSFAHGETKVQSLPDFYKTRFCATLLRTGKCPNGDSCSYAHNEAEMRDSAKPVEEATRVAHVRAQKAAAPRKNEKRPPIPEEPQRSSALNFNANFLSQQPIDENMMKPQINMLRQHMDRQAVLAGLAERTAQMQFAPAVEMPPRPPPAQQPKPLSRPAMNVAQSLAQAGLDDVDPLQLAVLASLLRGSTSRQSRVNGNPRPKNNAALLYHLQALLAAQEEAPEMEPSPTPNSLDPRYEKALARAGMRLNEPSGMRLSEAAGIPKVAGMQPAYSNSNSASSSSMLPGSRHGCDGLASMDMLAGDFDPQDSGVGLQAGGGPFQQNRAPSASEPLGLPLWQIPPPQQVPPPREMQLPKEHDDMAFTREKNKYSHLPSDLLVKNTFLEVGESNEFKDLSRFAVQTAPELPQISEELREHSLSHFGNDEQGSAEVRRLYDRAASQLGSREQLGPAELRRFGEQSQYPLDLGVSSESNLRHAGRNMLEPEYAAFGESSSASQGAWAQTAPRMELPGRRSSSASGSQEMVVKNTFLDVKSVEPAMNKHKIESLPDLPSLYSAATQLGQRPWAAGETHEEADVESSHMEPPRLSEMAPTVADSMQFPSPPPGLTSLTRSLRAADVADQLARDPRPAPAPVSLPHPLDAELAALPPELAELAALKGLTSQHLGKGAHKGVGGVANMEPRWQEGQGAQAAFDRLPRRQAWEGASSGHGDMGVLVKNTFLEVATEEDQALAAALAQHAVRTAPELPLLSSWANL